jgi:predicted AAA+ superfamily ATPase
MNSSDLFDILVDWNYWGSYRTQLLQRPAYLRRIEALFAAKTALVILGIRRAGKSSLIHLYLQELFAQKKANAKDCLIINFEDPRFTKTLTAQDLHKLYEMYLQNLVPSEPIIILDEVQNVEGWERFVRYLLEAKELRVIVTGSSSKLLDRELATVLTGRHVDIEVFPLTFKELLDFKGISYDSLLDQTTNKIEIRRLHDEYMKWGGFPEVLLCDSEERKRELLLRYFDDILLKDLVKRFNIKQVHKLEQMANLLTTNTATLQSYNRLKNQLQLSLDTVERFARSFEITRMFSPLAKYDHSLGSQMRSINKVYIADNGFYHAKGFRFSDNIGRLAENTVAIELQKRRLFHPQLEIYYWKDYQEREVDFVVKEATRVRQLIQVCWNVANPTTLKREVNSLLKASAELQCDDLLIITEDFQEQKEYPANGITRLIRFVPLWEWMLE